MAGTVSPRLSLAAYVEYMQDSYQLSDMAVATLLTKLATHYILKDSNCGHTGTGSESQLDSKDVSLQKL